MKNFREWLSDYLRYFLLVLAGVLVFFLILIGYNLYQSTREGETDGEVVVVNDTEAFTETESEYMPETETESESETETETESESESETETESSVGISSLNAAIDEDYSDKPYGETETESETETEAPEEEEASVRVSTYSADVYSDDSDDGYDDAYDDESYVEVYEEPEVYEPDYRTLSGACNLREGPGYDYDVITYYPAGTTVEYLGMESGWVKIEVDGMTGYIGPSFIN